MKMLVLLLGAVTMVAAAPQFGVDNNQKIPYSFAYGVSSPDTGDEKEHKETVLPSGVTEGEFRWLQPNGLYRTTRYTADDVSGFRAVVSEEPGERIANYYTNSLLDSVLSQGGSITPANVQSLTSFQQSGNRGFSTSQNSQGQNLGITQIQAFRPTQTIQTQGFSTSQLQAPRIPPRVQTQTISSGQTFQSQGLPVLQTPANQGTVIDGGIIDGGIIDGGIVDSTSSNTFGSGFNQFTSNTNSFTTGQNLNNFGSTSTTFSSGSNRFGNSGLTIGNANQGLAVLLAGNPRQISG